MLQVPVDEEESASYFWNWPTEYTQTQNGPDEFNKANSWSTNIRFGIMQRIQRGICGVETTEMRNKLEEKKH